MKRKNMNITPKKPEIFFFQTDSLNLVLRIILCFVITFPGFDFSFSWGIDPSLRFLFHHLQSEGLEMTREMIFPYGPLTFIMYPLFSNPWPALIVRMLIHVTIPLLLFTLPSESSLLKNIFSFFTALIILWLNTFHGLLTVLILLLFLHSLNGKKVYGYLAVLLSSFAVFIKINAAIMAGLLNISFLLILLLRRKNPAGFFRYLLSLLIFIPLVWLLISKNFSGFFDYFTGLIHLAAGNGTGASLYPPNSFYYLAIFVLAILFIPLLHRSEKSDTFVLLTALAFFAAWKHGFGRQDTQHNISFFIFSLSLLCIWFLYQDQKPKISSLLIPVSLVFLFLNFKYSFPWARAFEISFGGKNLVTLISDYPGLLEEAEKTSNKNVSIDVIPDSALSIIENHSVDIYPWDYAYLAANQLNWKPRPSIQAFLSYTNWIENRNLEYYNSSESPEFILWHYSKIQNKDQAGRMFGIDNRNILNMEPNLVSLFQKNYTPVYFHKDFTLLRKRKEAVNIQSEIISGQDIQWNKWIPVPYKEKGITIIKPEFDENLFDRLKSFFFKDNLYTIYIKNSSGNISRQRIIPDKAKEGIRINPLILDPYLSLISEPSDSVMFLCSGKKPRGKRIKAEFVSYNFTGEKECIRDYFLSGEIKTEISLIDFQPEKEDNSNLWKLKNENFISGVGKSGHLAEKLGPDSYSGSFSIPAHKLPEGKIQIRASAWIYSPANPKTQFIISLEKEGKTIIWDYIHVADQIIGKNQWNLCQNLLDIENLPGKFDNMKIYFLNSGKKDLYIKEPKVSIFISH